LLSHVHLALSQDGTVSQVKTAGNKYAHLVLRGGGESARDFKGQNYDERSLKEASARLHVFDLLPRVIVDCSHGNSDKKIEKQVDAVKAVLAHLQNPPIAIGSKVFPLAGVMLEANVNAGKQDFPKSPENVTSLAHGVSLTDPCLAFQDMENILTALAQANKQVRRE
jgi:3-deoxy-7-phosphoheptulonate synthase